MIIRPTPQQRRGFCTIGACMAWTYLFRYAIFPRRIVYPTVPFLSTPGALTKTPKVPMGPQTCWKSCGTLLCRSWTLRIAIKFRPLRGRSCAAPAGPIWEKQTFAGASSCKFGCDVWQVRWDAVFLFSNVKGHCHGCFFDNIWQHWQAKSVE